MLLLLLAACAPLATDPTAPTPSAALARHGGTPHVVLSAPHLGWGMSSGDLNGDGITDLVATSDEAGAGSLHIWYGQPDATLTPGLVISLSGLVTLPELANEETYRPHLAILDLQGDGLDDIVLSWTGSGVQTWLSVTGGFTALAPRPEVGRHLTNAGDVDGDGRPDLFALEVIGATDYSIYSVQQVAFTGGRLVPRSLLSEAQYCCGMDGSFARSLGAPGDLNGDGYNDLALGFIGGWGNLTRLEWYAGGPASLSGPPSGVLYDQDRAYRTQDIAPKSAADLNNDGYDDLLVLHQGADDQVRWHPGGPSGTADAIPVAGPPRETAWADNALLPGDLDGDGTPDLLVASDTAGRGRVHRFRNVGGALEPQPDLFWQGETATARLGLSMVSLGDMDGDGAVEVAIAEPGNNAALIVRGGPGEGCAPGDVPVQGYVDADADGATGPWSPLATCGTVHLSDDGDCDDRDDSVFPGAPDAGPATVDADCDGVAHCAQDSDQDGSGTPTIIDIAAWSCDNRLLSAADDTGDCDDVNPLIRPGTRDQSGNNIDEDCDGLVTCNVDADADGYPGYATVNLPTCALGPGADCADTSPTRHPGAVEVPVDGVDTDCDGYELCFADLDHDGYGTSTTVPAYSLTCQNSGVSAITGDCDDTTIAIRPRASDPPDGVDADCDGDELPDLVIRVMRNGRLLLDGANTTRSGRVAVLASRAGPGAGPCPRALGGRCSALLQPSLVWRGPGHGAVSLQLTPPPGLSGTQVWFELWSIDGAYTGASALVPVTLP